MRMKQIIRKHSNKRIRAGFTLVELLVVVAIMTVVLSAVTIGVTSAMSQYRSAMRRSQTDILYSTLYESISSELRSATSIKVNEDTNVLESYHSEILNTSGAITNSLSNEDGTTTEGIICVGTHPVVSTSAYQDGVKAYIEPIVYDEDEEVFVVDLELKMDIGEGEEFVKSHTFKVHPLNY